VKLVVASFCSDHSDCPLVLVNHTDTREANTLYATLTSAIERQRRSSRSITAL
jgi:hypothetical protein